MKLIKMHGAGNDFLFVDIRSQAQKDELLQVLKSNTRAQWVEHVCHRNFGVGADGLAFLESHESADFAWDFYNSDGSHAEMCGNAARCVCLLYSELTGKTKNISFLSASGPIGGQVNSDGTVTVDMGPVRVLKPTEGFSHKNFGDWDFTLLDTGVPHAVLRDTPEESLTLEQKRTLSSELRNDSLVGPRGANVTWLKDINNNSIESVSFERGVEDFTLACGTGVVAAAYVKTQAETNVSQVNVQVPGGKLTVDFTQNSPRLTGPATWVADIELRQ